MNGLPGSSRSSVALIGMRGSGKTTAGRALAARLGGDHVDTDDWVIQRAGRSIRDIFARDGEQAFRALERAAIQEITASPPRVISVGGGAILDSVNVQRLREVAIMVWLTASIEELADRVASDKTTPHSRPSLTGQPVIEELAHVLAVREPLYRAAADFTVETGRSTQREIARRIAHLLSGP